MFATCDAGDAQIIIMYICIVQLWTYKSKTVKTLNQKIIPLLKYAFIMCMP